MDDLISRQAAIDAMESYSKFLWSRYHETFNLGAVASILSDLPSAQRTGRKKGKWIIKDNPKIRWYRVTCSECGEDVTSVIPLIGFFPNVKALWDFCPYCGARMEE